MIITNYGDSASYEEERCDSTVLQVHASSDLTYFHIRTDYLSVAEKAGGEVYS